MKIDNIPAWLSQRETETVFQGRKRNRFIEGTLKQVLSFSEDTLFNETVSKKRGLLQGTWPGIKLLLIFFLIVLLSLQKNIFGMLPFIIFCLLMALLSSIPPGLFFKRLLPGFLFALVIALPASLNLVVRGEPLFMLFSFSRPEHFLGIHFPKDIFISREGLISALGLILRVTGSLMLIFLITFTTSPPKLIKGVGFFMPGFLNTLISVSYRYLFYLVRRLEEFILVIKARVPGGGPERRLIGSRAANLLILSLRLKDDLRMAMDARGVQYSFKWPAEKFRIGSNDILFLLAVSVTAIGAFIL